ncbi:hypothetical protein E2C01_054073 [Portunus trituberculatus]|uniref:Uncharacterized protein n=1 Tax=Portunus trituberculatus TaxID=210409 RepID=A0A5B7GSR3_PORTR|nr:hypothetical protein [Portunus trituberculatus]
MLFLCYLPRAGMEELAEVERRPAESEVAAKVIKMEKYDNRGCVDLHVGNASVTDAFSLSPCRFAEPTPIFCARTIIPVGQDAIHYAGWASRVLR